VMDHSHQTALGFCKSRNIDPLHDSRQCGSSEGSSPRTPSLAGIDEIRHLRSITSVAKPAAGWSPVLPRAFANETTPRCIHGQWQSRVSPILTCDASLIVWWIITLQRNRTRGSRPNATRTGSALIAVLPAPPP
jgi:hypothetical protein